MVTEECMYKTLNKKLYIKLSLIRFYIKKLILYFKIYIGLKYKYTTNALI